MVARNAAEKIGKPTIVLGVLNAVGRDSGVTQRHLATELGIALGLANAYLKRCAKKGLIKIRHVPLNRYAYYLTPHGFAEKSRLTAEYLSVSFEFFRRARGDAVSLLAACRARGWSRAALWGAGELAEVMILSAAEAGVEIPCVIDAAAAGSRCGGRPVVADLDAAVALAGGIETIVLTETHTPEQSLAAVRAAARRHGLAAERLVVPEMLRLSPAAAESAA
jgi:DNA-binding MarR family transcriptional regulator